MTSLRNMLTIAVAGSALSFGVFGCQVDKSDLVPKDAVLMQSGNRTMHFIAADDGTAYVYDHQTNKLLWSGQVTKGQAIDLDAMKSQISVDGRIAVNSAMNPADMTDVYFVAAPMPAVVAPPTPPAPPPAAAGQPNLSGGFTVTPSVNLQQNNGANGPASVTVQPGLTVAPATQPTTAPSASPTHP